MRTVLLICCSCLLWAESQVTINLDEVELPDKIVRLLNEYDEEKAEAAQEYRQEVEELRDKLIKRLERESKGLDQVQALALTAKIEGLAAEGAVDIFGNPIKDPETYVATMVAERGSSVGWGVLPDGTGVPRKHQKLTRRDHYLVGGQPVRQGIMAHPPRHSQSVLLYTAPQGVSRLSGAVGIDDVAAGKTATPLIFRVEVAGKERWKSKPIPRDGVVESFSLPVRPGDKVRFIVACPGAWTSALAVWIDPVFR